MKRSSDPILATLRIFDTQQSLQLYVHPLDEILSSRMLELGVWEPTETACILSLLEPGDLVIDVGANIGYYTLLASSIVGEMGRVIALEPDDANYELLQHNVNEFSSANVSLIKKAAAVESSAMFLYRSPTNFGDHRSYSSPDHDEGHAIEGIALDKILLELDGPAALVKIDCQGAESRILQGMSQVFASARLRPTALLLEFWPYGLAQSGSSADEMLALIPLSEYQMWNIGPWDHKPYKIDLAGLRELADKEKNPELKPVTFFTNLLLIRNDASQLHSGINLLCEQKSSLRDPGSVRLKN